MGNVEYLNKIGVLHERTVLAHGIHLSKKELGQLVKSQTGLTHCPSSNLKLASGIAHIHEYREKGLKVGLGADGAPCNNLMDPFMEMRLAALLQKPISGPTALNAREAFTMATIDGARVLGAADKIGSLEVGKCADMVIVDRSHPSHFQVEDPYSDLVYSSTGRDVRDVWIDGRLVVKDKEHQVYDVNAVRSLSADQLNKLKARLKRSDRH
jgi:5-methylthioadenosine/S-adenosylhomocysteine deaminase